MFKDQYIVNNASGVIFDIKRFAIHDGRGIRTTVFFKGCPLNCHWCHNPESQKKEPEETPAKKTIGQRVSVDEVMAEIEKDILFYDESGGGVTFSGGEPLLQVLFLKALLDECKKRDIRTILDTSGYAASHIFDSIIDKVDLFHYDLKLMDNELHRKYTGVTNRQINENLKTLSRRKKNVVIRFPVIPGITDTPENLTEISEFISSLKGINKIDLLPYHRTAADKYRRLNKEYLLDGLIPPANKEMTGLKDYFTALGLKVKIGG